MEGREAKTLPKAQINVKEFHLIRLEHGSPNTGQKLNR